MSASVTLPALCRLLAADPLPSSLCAHPRHARLSSLAFNITPSSYGLPLKTHRHGFLTWTGSCPKDLLRDEQASLCFINAAPL
ncbi:unnamed protein product [Parajaminaea phylloscopi]